MNAYEIYIIWLREMKKFWADKAFFVTSIVVPLLGVFIIGMGLGSFVKIPGLEVGYLEYFGTGAIAVLSISAAMFVGFSLIRDKKGFVKELMVVPISRYSIMIGKILSEITTQIFTLAVAVAIMMVYIKSDTGLLGIVKALGIMFMIVFGFAGLGIILASSLQNARSYNQLMTIILIPLIFLSGEFFPINGLPSFLQFFAHINPLTYGVDALRGVLVNVSEFGVGYDIMILAVFAVVTLSIATSIFSKGLEK